MSENGEIDGGGLEDAHPMEPDHEACYRAISTRDARFDGRIFTAVRTTRIYCRPICSARTPKRENVMLRARTRANEGRPRTAEVVATAEAWRPWRTYAAQHLWTMDARTSRPNNRISL
jgi:Metal binding domain of Ada